MAKTIMIQGTCSNAGKSLITAGLCRILKQEGYRVAPFKSQNMALNSFITEDGMEMGRAQVMQAEAAGVAPDCRMNPILLKPNSDAGSQVIVNGKVFGNYSATEYYDNKEVFAVEAKKAFESLAEDYDVIILEGAGSPAEINLKDKDIVNMGMAKMINSPVLLVGDIDRGGVFASLAGTMLLFDQEERKLVKGVIVNKFRGDIEILKPGLTMLEEIIQKPVLGVVPYMKLDIDDEDSLSEKIVNKPSSQLIDIAVIRLPRISNFTDFNALEYLDDVGVRYVDNPRKFGDPDLVIIPGTKNTMADLLWMRQIGIEGKIMQHYSKGKPIFGVCGGYQMLGQKLSDPYGIEQKGEIEGLKLLPHSTVFEEDKTTKASIGKLAKVDGIFSKISGVEYQGYEIHMGKSAVLGNIINNENVYGTYIHGIFDRPEIAKNIIGALMEAKGIDSQTLEAFNIEEYKESQYDKLADGIRSALDMEAIFKLV